MLHLETIDEAVAAEQLAKEMQYVDESKAREIEQELAQSKQQGYQPVTDEEWKAHHSLNLKFDLYVIPFCTLIYLFCGLDRANIGNAATDNFTQDLGMPATAINTATSWFIITYVPFMPITTYFGRRVGQPLFLGVAGFCWGILTLSQAFIKTEAQLIAIRLLVGFFESGFFSTAAAYISIFYPRFNLAFRISMFFFAYAISGGFGGLIAYGAFNISGSLYGWQYLFLIEGSLTILLALITPFWLPTSPGTAWFLTPAERHYAEKRMVMDSSENLADAHRISKRDILETLKDWKLWMMLPCAMITTMGPTGFTTFLPLVVKGLGYSGAMANLMSVPPYIAGACLVLLFCWSSDRHHERCIHIVIGLTIVIIGLALTVALPEEQVHARYGALIVLLAGTFIATPLNASWLAGNTPDPGKRALVLAFNGWGNIAQVFSSELFQSKYGPSYSFSMKVLLGLMILAFFGYSFVAITLRLVNRHRAKKVAQMTPQELEEENLSDTRVGDKKLTFVYGT
ncbi:MFS general substrate transporter [Dacryopinax primogenitus]|uniref:MFS general substrate transporter n=1 Tax=Dacryopinax primogenitus (strain DJM 731) TaxID=1858805 RepID=M5GF75_DACPD|nr:MFS general substrate transporter [Dacryopinax primogenitus]EJU03913.1 MFS general substrate transporter [Dacryopinax primogenitus]